MTDYNDISHSGVIGMKWGHRKASTSKSTASKSKVSSASKKKATKPKIEDMSDEELKKIVNRMSLEKQYKTLNQKAPNKGKVAVEKMMKTGSTLATATTTAITLYNNATKIQAIINGAAKTTK